MDEDENSIRWAVGLTGFFIGIFVMVLFQWVYNANHTVYADEWDDHVTYDREFNPYPDSLDKFKGETYHAFMVWCYEKKGGSARFKVDESGAVVVVYCDLPEGLIRVYPVTPTRTRTQNG